MSRSAPEGPPRLVCRCMGVSSLRIADCVRAGAETVEDVQAKLPAGRGCSECYDSGFKGRMGIHEVLETDVELQKLIISNPSRDDLTEYMEDRDFQNLFSDGLERVLDRQTTIEEVSRVTSI